jgi:hypothetical protein
VSAERPLAGPEARLLLWIVLLQINARSDEHLHRLADAFLCTAYPTSLAQNG